MLRTIYALRDPRDQTVRYVGATAHMKGRWKMHFYQGPMEAKQVAKAAWVLFLRTIGMAPRMEILEEVDGEAWKDRERLWIKFLEPPYNIQPGGTAKGHPKSEETRRRMSAAQKGKPKNLTEEGRAKLADAGAKGGKKFWASMDEEQKAAFIRKVAAARWGKISPEERSRMARERNLKRWGKA